MPLGITVFAEVPVRDRPCVVFGLPEAVQDLSLEQRELVVGKRRVPREVCDKLDG